MDDTEKKVRFEHGTHLGFAAAFSVVKMALVPIAAVSGGVAATSWTAFAITGSETAENLAWASSPVLLLALLGIWRLSRAIDDHGQVVGRTSRILRRRYN